MRDHTKLRAFEMADEVVMLVYQVTAGFPREEMYGLSSVPTFSRYACVNE